MANPNVKPPYTFLKMTPEQRAECGRKGGIAKREVVKKRKEIITEAKHEYLRNIALKTLEISQYIIAKEMTMVSL